MQGRKVYISNDKGVNPEKAMGVTPVLPPTPPPGYLNNYLYTFISV